MALAGAAVLVLSLGRGLWSQVLNLVTSYPVPSGIYNQITTTGNAGATAADTTLNRDAGNTLLAPPTNAGGKAGIGTTAPAEKLDVAGDIQAASGNFDAGAQIGDDPAACTAAKAGALRFRGGRFEGCDGAAWKALADAGESPKCYAAGGAWAENQKLCYFSGGSCPAGWRSSNYTSTVPQTCTAIIQCGIGRGSRPCPSSCTTGSHSRSTAARESCSYRIPPRWRYDTNPTATCYATIIERGCAASP